MARRVLHRVLKNTYEVVLNLPASVISAARIVAESRATKFQRLIDCGQRLVVIGTGPSLRKSLSELQTTGQGDAEFMSVNDYYKDSSFQAIKPKFHVVADPLYWDEDYFGEHGEPLVDGLKSVDWGLTLYVPRRARNTRLHELLSSMQIQYCFYNTTPLSGFEWFQKFAFSQMLGMPRAQNVLVAALSIGLWLDFRSICLLGADHSWHQEIEVDQSNTLMVRQMHSYDGEVRLAPFYKPASAGESRVRNVELCDRETFRVREIFRAWATMHESYEQVEKLARQRHSTIVNGTPVSFIDAFRRATLTQFLGWRPAGAQDACTLDVPQ